MPVSRMAWDRLENINFAKMREYRLNRVKEAMKRHNIGTLVTWDAWNIRYISSVYATVPCRWVEAQMCVLPVNGDPYVFGITSFSPYAMRKELPWMKDKIWPQILETKMCTTVDEIMPVVDKIMEIATEHGLQNELIGIDGSQSELLLKEAFATKGAQIVDAKHPMFEARMIKCQEEIECCRLACANADAAFYAMQKAIVPGVTECELMGIGMKELYKNGADEVQEFVVASGPRTNPLHIDYTDRMVRPGDLVVIDINGNSYMGYKSCYYRTFCCGKATQEQKDLHKAARDMMYDCIDLIKAGRTTEEVMAKWPKSPSHWGYDNWLDVAGYALGHGLGISLHEKPVFRPASVLREKELGQPHPVLEEGMVLAIETWAGKRGGRDGVRLEENIVVTKDGYDLLTKYPIDHLIECEF